MNEYDYDDYDDDPDWYDSEEYEPACDICGGLYNDHDEIAHMRFGAISSEAHYFMKDHPCLECGEQWRMVRIYPPDETVMCEQVALSCDSCHCSAIMLLDDNYQAFVIYRGTDWMFQAVHRESGAPDIEPILPF